MASRDQHRQSLSGASTRSASPTKGGFGPGRRQPSRLADGAGESPSSSRRCTNAGDRTDGGECQGRSSGRAAPQSAGAAALRECALGGSGGCGDPQASLAPQPPPCPSQSASRSLCGCGRPGRRGRRPARCGPRPAATASSSSESAPGRSGGRRGGGSAGPPPAPSAGKEGGLSADAPMTASPCPSPAPAAPGPQARVHPLQRV